MNKNFKKADRTARIIKTAPTKANRSPTFRNRVAYAAAMEVLG